MRESKLQKQCLDWIKENYQDRLVAVNIHGGGYTNKGFPDLIVFGQGRAVLIELKSDSGYKQQADQKIWQRRFEKIGTPCLLIRDFESFKNCIREVFGHENQS